MTSPRRRPADAPGLLACGIGGRRRLLVRRVRSAMRRAAVSRYTIGLITAVGSKVAAGLLTGHGH